MLRSISYLGVLLRNPSLGLKKFCRTVLIVKLRKGEKNFIAKFNKILLKFVLKIVSETINCLRGLSSIAKTRVS